MDMLHICLFGRVHIVHPNYSEPLKLSRSSQSLFAYLLLQQRLVPREVLMDVFWDEHSPDRARSSLTTAIWRLRQLLEPESVRPGTYLITSSTGEVGFNWDSHHWLDSERLERHLHPLLRKPLLALNEDEVKEIEADLTLYRGELLEGMYDDWALRERERFRMLRLSGLNRLMEFYASRNNFEQSIACGREILHQDPLREEIHRDLMRIYLLNGQRGLAMRQYEQCRAYLQQELGIPPLEETEALYRQILALEPTANLPTGSQPIPQDMIELAHELQIIKRNLEENSKALARIAQVVTRLICTTTPRS
jgi:DNA-binding SARP family transcriptional activator